MSWAKKAAPYIHARIAAVTHSGSVDGKLTGKLIIEWGDGAHGDVAAAQADPAQRYLTSFAWHFNRRYQLDTLTEHLAYACARTAPHPYGSSSLDE